MAKKISQKSTKKKTEKKASAKKAPTDQIEAKINWYKVGFYGAAVLIYVGAKGAFGPKVQVVSVVILKGVIAV